MNGINRLVTEQVLRQITAVVGADSVFTGDIKNSAETTNQGIKVDGVVEGSIVLADGGVVHIGPSGHVKGARIVADHILVEGRVDGQLHARTSLELAGSCHVKGQVEYAGAISMHNLAKVRAQLQYVGVEAAEEVAA